MGPTDMEIKMKGLLLQPFFNINRRKSALIHTAVPKADKSASLLHYTGKPQIDYLSLPRSATTAWFVH